MNVAILVLTYSCEINDSLTIKSIMSSDLNFNGFKLVLWNNGPDLYGEEESVLECLHSIGFEVSLRQTITNQPLSFIYNKFIEEFSSDYHVILDHDSNLSSGYLKYILDVKSGGIELAYIGVPSISCRGVAISPSVNNFFSPGPYNKKDLVIGIGSGLILNIELSKLLKKNFGGVFDEHFSLYGVDTTLFYRLNILGLSNEIKTIPGFEHSFSRFEKESINIKRFRSKERGWDSGLRLVNYFSMRELKLALLELIRRFVRFDYNYISRFFLGVIRGQHENCKMRL